jgi:hypothetical protein
MLRAMVIFGAMLIQFKNFYTSAMHQQWLDANKGWEHAETVSLNSHSFIKFYQSIKGIFQWASFSLLFLQIRSLQGIL